MCLLVVLTALNLVFWVGLLFNLPGTWLIVLVTAALKWWQPGYVRLSWTMLGVTSGLAVLGEALEFVIEGGGGPPRGGSTGAAALASLGSLIGGVIGTALPVPNCGHCHRSLSWGLRRLAARGAVGGASTVSELSGGLGSGHGSVLGNGIQARPRRHHCGRSGAGRVLLMGMDKGLYDRMSPAL
jgi:uncharacterized protein DUF456